MPKPGSSVTQEEDYKSKDSDHRDYWEKGQNDGLTPEQKNKLKEHADRASRYKRPNRYADDVPRKPGRREVDHGALMRNVKHYTADTLKPHGDNPNAIAPKRPLGDMLDRAGTPANPVGPPPHAENNWVCINLAEFMAGLMRELGYPVRETNVYLTNGGEYQYQSAAIQVWFDGKWHWVDPFTCKYDPMETWQDRFSDMDVIYWDGTKTPGYRDWRVLTGMDWMTSKWKEMDDDEVGGDLQDRFYPKPGQEQPPAEGPGKYKAKAEKAGCFIKTKTRNVRMYLRDSHGRITDGELNEIPGAYHIRAGTPIFYCKQEWLEPGEDPGPDYPARQPESVFFGTHLYRASREEIGTHELTLYLTGKSGIRVHLEHVIMGDPNPASVRGLPEFVTLSDEVTPVPFSVTIDPVNAAFHLLYSRFSEVGLADPKHYDAMAKEVEILERRAERHRARLSERVGLPAKKA